MKICRELWSNFDLVSILTAFVFPISGMDRNVKFDLSWRSQWSFIDELNNTMFVRSVPSWWHWYWFYDLHDISWMELLTVDWWSWGDHNLDLQKQKVHNNLQVKLNQNLLKVQFCIFVKTSRQNLLQ